VNVKVVISIAVFVSVFCSLRASRAAGTNDFVVKIGSLNAGPAVHPRNNPQAPLQKPAEVLLTPQRRAVLERVVGKPYIVEQKRIDKNTVVYHWTNGLHGAVTTQRVVQVLGKPAKNAWQSKLEAKDREKQTIIDDLKAIKEKPTKKGLEDIIKKNGK